MATSIVGQSGLLSMSEACRFVGKHPNTLRAYTKKSDGLPCYRVMGGQRKFKTSDLAQFFGLENAEEKCSEGGRILAYCRTSSDGQRESLQRQIERVKEFCLEQYGMEPIVFSEIGSALNYRRKNSLSY
jgi:predicted site-specific integrase-resolvase